MQERIGCIERMVHQIQSHTLYMADTMRSTNTTSPSNDKPKESVLPLNANWSLSLTPQGLRIDTGIVSLQDLYNILLSGVSHLQTPTKPDESPPASPLSTVSRGSTHRNAEKAIIIKHNPRYKSKDVMFPLYSAWEESGSHTPSRHEKDTVLPASLDRDNDRLFDHYGQCFLCFPLPDLDTFLIKCKNKTACPLLINAILSWAARHAAIYHGMFVGQDPNTVGERYYTMAQTLLKDRFLTPSIDTVHALLLMYIYSIGKTGPARAQAESEAYTFLGLAIRMCLDLGLHQEDDRVKSELEREKRRRLFAAVEFLETLRSAHSDKPMLFPDEEVIGTLPPKVLDSESGEQRYRAEFTVHRHKLSQIYRNIHASLSVKTPLLSTVTALEKQLQDWYTTLPVYFHYNREDPSRRQWASTSFKEQACLKLNFEYHFQMCQIHSIFLPNPDDTTCVVSLLSLRICQESADAITDLLECWAQLRQPWCHFTLDTLVMACMVYSNQLRSSQLQVQQTAKHQMRRITRVLQRSPVRHHKYVKTLLHRIEGQTDRLGLSEEEQDTHSPVVTHESISEVLPLFPRTPFATNDWEWLRGSQPPSPTTVQLHSAFDMTTAADMALSDLFRFSDFVYTPIMDVQAAETLLHVPASCPVSPLASWLGSPTSGVSDVSGTSQAPTTATGIATGMSGISGISLGTSGTSGISGISGISGTSLGISISGTMDPPAIPHWSLRQGPSLSPSNPFPSRFHQ
ncbi:fungal-specific transcription factor domain-containing protein [Spinellus fusiger]|nr:fungal-specific transcription factor domain-containing protein [Spinellus fusiger]